MVITFYVVFNNDTPLAVCTSKAQVSREMSRQVAAETNRVKRQVGNNIGKIAEHMQLCYFHWHGVSVSEA